MSSATSFSLTHHTDLPTHNATAREYQHNKTGCTVFHFACDDPESLFCFSLRTPPFDSSGVAHILEHSVLCGSEDFPLKDSFAQLMKGSMHTFLNAMTYPDRTLYPASSAVERDIFNMLGVYGDAVFFPLLRPEVFSQEGYHMIFKPEASIQGVVYNEMKGEFSQRDSVVARACFNSLFDNSHYVHESGGDPQIIPSLTYKKFKNFHTQYYHPSNCCVFLYGSAEIETFLHILDEKFLSRFSQIESQPISLDHSFNREQRDFFVPYPSHDNTEGKSSIHLNWLLFPTTDYHKVLMGSLVNELLLGHSSSPLYTALMDSGLGKAVSANSGMERSVAPAIYSVGIDDAARDSSKALERVIFDLLSRLSEKGFEDHKVDAILRKSELSNREVRRGSANAFRILNSVSHAWTYGASLIESLSYTDRLTELRNTWESQKDCLQKWIDEHLLNNDQYNRVTVYPDVGLLSSLQKTEQEYLNNAVTSVQKTRTEALHRFQQEDDSEENLARIPRLSREDIPKRVRHFDYEHDKLCSVPLMLHPLFCNDVIHMQMVFDLQGIDEKLALFLPLLSTGFTECGTQEYEPDTLIDLINSYSLGVSSDISCETILDGKMRRFFCLSFSFLRSQSNKALDLLFNLLLSPAFVTRHPLLRKSLGESYSSQISSFASQGHLYALYRASQSFSLSRFQAEQWQGLSSLFFLKESLASPQTAICCEKLARELFQKERCHLTLALDPSCRSEFLPLIEKKLANLPSSRLDKQIFMPSLPPSFKGAEAIVCASSVAYNALVLPAFYLTEEAFAAEILLCQLFDTHYLWENIRMRGGAYGAFAIPRGQDGLLLFCSYRDPHVHKSFEIFRSALQHYSQHSVSQDDIDHALFGILGKELQSLSPKAQSRQEFSRFLHGITPDLRQSIRDHLLSLNPHKLSQTANNLYERLAKSQMAIVSSQDLLDSEARDIFPIHKLSIPV